MIRKFLAGSILGAALFGGVASADDQYVYTHHNLPGSGGVYFLRGNSGGTLNVNNGTSIYFLGGGFSGTINYRH